MLQFFHNKEDSEMNREEYLINKLSSSYIGDDGAIVGDKIYSMDAFLRVYILEESG